MCRKYIALAGAHGDEVCDIRITSSRFVSSSSSAIRTISEMRWDSIRFKLNIYENATDTNTQMNTNPTQGMQATGPLENEM